MTGTVKQKIVLEADTSQVSSEAKKASTALGGTEQALKGAGKASKEFEASLKASTASLKQSKDTTKEARRLLSLYSSEVKISGKSSKEAKAAQDAFTGAVEKAKSEYNATRIELNKSEQALSKLKAEGKETTAVYQQMERQISRTREAVARQEVQVKKLAASQSQLNTSTQKSEGSQGGFLSTLGKGKTALLGYAAAATAGAAAVIGIAHAIDDYSGKAQRLEAVSRAQKLTIDEARESTKGLISDFELASLSNQALQLKVATSGEKFAEFAEAAVKLGYSVGAEGGAAKQVEDLVGALGRGSTELLDNLGISLKASEAQRIYAERLGLTVSQLDANQKSEAFRVIGLERVIEASKKTNVELDGQGSSIQRLKTDWENFLNKTVIPGVASATDKTLEFVKTSPELQALADIVQNRLTLAWDLLSKSLSAMWAVAQPILKPFIDLAAEVDLALTSIVGVLENGRAAVVDFFHSFDVLPDAADDWVEEWGVMLVPVLNLVKALEVALGLINEVTGARSNQIKRMVLEEGRKQFDEREEREEIQRRGSLAEEEFVFGDGKETFAGGSLAMPRTRALPTPPKDKKEKKKKGKRSETPEINTAFEEQLDLELEKLAQRTEAMQEQATLAREIAEEERQFEIEAMQQRLEIMELERELHGETRDQQQERLELEAELTEAQRQQALDRGDLATWEYEQKKANLEKEKKLREANARETEKQAKEAQKLALERERESAQMATAITGSLGQVTVATIEAAQESENAAKKAIAGWAKAEAIRMALVAAKEAALAVAAAASFNAPGAAAHGAASGQAAAVAVAMGAVAGGVGATISDEALPGVGEGDVGAGLESGQRPAFTGSNPTERPDRPAEPGAIETEVPISHSNADLGRPIVVQVANVNFFGDSPEERANIGRELAQLIEEAQRADGDPIR